AQKVMQALAVYNRPVSPAAIDYLLQPHLPSIDSALVLNRLVNMHFARREAGRYYLHPADKEYAFSIIPEGEKRKEERIDSDELRFTQYALLDRAADYFAQIRKPRAEWKKLDDLAAQLAEFDLRCAAGDYDTAGYILADIDFDYLQVWGHYHLLISYNESLQGKLTNAFLKKHSLTELGLAYRDIGDSQKCIQCHNKVLEIAKEEKDRAYESISLGNLGAAYQYLGDIHKAIKFYEQALVIAREIGEKKTAGNQLGNLGAAYNYLGETRKSIEFYEQALMTRREIDDHIGEGVDLSNLGEQYFKLGEYDKSNDFYRSALQNARETGNKYGESKRLNGLASVYLEKGDLQNAIKHAQESIQIGQEMSSPEVCIESSNTLAVTLLLSGILKDALHVVQEAEKYDQPYYNFNISSLHGIIALRQGERETAQEAFAKSIAQADEILAKTPEYYSALDAKGLALAGLLVIGNWRLDGERDQLHAEAIESFKQTRKIAPHAGVVKSVLRLFDELVKCDEEGMLKDVREVINTPLVE
ncbi:MAG: tetratricopeptide repeat protein, partial [bacterium]|nr:tetratricopeptide repeat protein [bacterium]